MLTLEFQHFEGCPNGPQMLDNVKRAITGLEDKIILKEVFVETDEEAIKRNFRGSPTLLINGEDFEGLPVPKEPKLACRIYLNGIPTPKELRNKILQYLEAVK